MGSIGGVVFFLRKIVGLSHVARTTCLVIQNVMDPIVWPYGHMNVLNRFEVGYTWYSGVLAMPRAVCQLTVRVSYNPICDRFSDFPCREKTLADRCPMMAKAGGI